MASTYLERTVSSASNRRTWTWSAWVKLGALSGNQSFFTARSDNANYSTIRIEPDRFHIFDLVSGGFNHQVKTNRRLRDPNAWYHLVVAFDTTQSTASDRIKMYVNGEQETSLAESSYPAENYEGFINRNRDHYIGQGGNLGDRFDGCMSHINFVDGTALTPSSFGETDSTTGEWKIKTSPSVTYGTEGFFILKDGNSVTDQSGNSNNWTVGGGTLTNTEDCPSNVFCTMNPLDFGNSGGTSIAVAEKGNTYITSSSSNAWRGIHGTLGIKTGKYYYEVKISASDGDTGYLVGWCDFSYNTDDDPNNGSPNAKMYGRQSLTLYHDTGKTDNFFSSTSSGDILMVAFDMDNGKLWFGKNGTWQNSGGSGGDTTTYSSTTLNTSYPDVTGITVSNNTGFYTPSCQIYNDGYAEFNFGNGYFGTTAVSSAGTNASGIGIFEYDVPTGYTALSTKGLNE